VGKYGSICLLFALLVSGVPSSVQALSKEDAKYGYSLDLPSDWKQIPMSQVNAHQTAMGGMPGNIHFIDAYEPFEHRTPFQYPYLMIQEMPYPNQRSIQSISEAELKQIVSTITGASEADIKKSIPDKAASLITKVGKINASYATSPPSFTMDFAIKSPVAAIGTIRGKSLALLAKDRIVTMHIYDQDSRWESQGPRYQTMLDGFKLLPGQQITFGANSGIGEPSFNLRLGNIMICAVIGAVVAVIAAWQIKRV
jgi:hypothetical protein